MTISKEPEQKQNYRGELLIAEPLSDYTTWRVGGKATRLYKPADIDDLAAFIKQLPPDEPLLWIGLGSNLLIRDAGFKGTVIITQGKLNGLQLIDTHKVYVEAGVSCASMARFCARNHLAGTEFLAGIPGTMGGALRMNAGCHGGETWNHVVEVQTMTRSGEIRKRSADEFAVAYRHVEGLQDEWFISATFHLPAGDKAESLKMIKDLLAHRSSTQPTSDYNCGSVFRNPQGGYAARLIESCGFKGYKIGEAMVSPKHANFIINYQGLASAFEIESLIAHIQNSVREQQAIELIQEVHIVGEKDER